MLRKSFLIVALFTTTSFAQAVDAVSVSVRLGDSLISISQRYLKEPALRYWPEVAKLNKLSAPYTIYPGATLRLPLHLMVAQSAPAKWLAVTGDVRVTQQTNAKGVLAIVGSSLVEGERVVVPESASALLELADKSQVKLLSNTVFLLDEHRYYKGNVSAKDSTELSGTNAFLGLLRVLQGSVEIRATPATDRAKPLRIQTPTSVVGVRGTEFRVTHDQIPTIAGAMPDIETHAEVVKGLVLAQLDETRKVQIPAGFGVKLDPRVSQNPTVIPLLEAPDVSNWSLKQDKLTLEFPAMPSVQSGRKVVAYLVEVASDEAMTKVVFDHRFVSEKPVRIPNLLDGAWYITVRGVDEQGIEGRDAKVTVILKARPQPPFIQTPRPREKIVQGQDVKLGWAGFSDTTTYLVEVLDEQQKTTDYQVKGIALSLKNLQSGRYQWRIASQVTTPQAVLDVGPWSEYQNFMVVATPEPAQAKVDDAKTLNLRWEDQKAKQYEVQLAREPSFNPVKAPVIAKTTDKPELAISNPESGQYFIRYRAIEEDGFISGWSGTMTVEVPSNSFPIWLFLGGLATLVL